ncbi:D-glycero-beta-D-manno-heptose-7-phosphate kinase [Mucilaginibacter paludis]|uniref:RfaE bifunctional protein n=1 Tax=Mucilaginibacter paludis DSM 18603 TaxID=714943 RepID=H1YCN3_9SPHI|nr:D-glycero-beta-D-manno-heptose-7-phosphate kinase [Mucilaginibacter paludis]EHQ24220.1 rfaE bifunctional protein [Mucilaginibacter paludis DSM 18603]
MILSGGNPFKNINIAVIGDIMIDHYIYGTCERISPEAPVQVVDVASEVHMLGGAGNVLKNLEAFGCSSSLISVCGNDDAGRILEQELSRLKPAFYHLVKDDSRQTTIKTRVMASKHHLLRLDKENKHAIDTDIAADIVNFLRTKIQDIDALILSDYCKGVFTADLVKEIITLCNQHNVITLVDSKDRDLSKYLGASLIKPNKREASLASGISIVDDSTLEQACRIISETTQCKSVVVTLSENGIGIYHDNHLIKMPTKALDVFDVTGAGDTVIAALAFGLANRLSLQQSCDFANHAAAIVVGKAGSAVATLEEINNLTPFFN